VLFRRRAHSSEEELWDPVTNYSFRLASNSN